MSEVYSFKVKTSYRNHLVDITPQVKEIISKSRSKRQGFVLCFQAIQQVLQIRKAVHRCKT